MNIGGWADAPASRGGRRPDAPRKVLDVTKLANLGWSPTVALTDGVRTTYQWFLDNEKTGAIRGREPLVSR